MTLPWVATIPGIEIGLYRDDGLAVLNQTPRQIEKAKKQICQIFANNNLKITADANKKVVNFLDVILDLNTGRFKPVKPSVPNHLPLRFTFTANRTTHPISLETYPKQLTGGYQAFLPITRFLMKERLSFRKRYGRVAIHLN